MVTQPPEISDDEVFKATGRRWPEWFGLFAGTDMAQSTHEEIVAFLREEHGVPSWWQEAIANAFEQSIGRVADSETDDGFQLDVSHVLGLPAETVFQAWIDGELRSRWLRHGDFEPVTVRPPGTVRGKWMPDGSWIDVDISAGGDGRCNLAIRHRKLASSSVVEQMRKFWEGSVGRLVERVGNAR